MWCIIIFPGTGVSGYTRSWIRGASRIPWAFLFYRTISSVSEWRKQPAFISDDNFTLAFLYRLRQLSASWVDEVRPFGYESGRATFDIGAILTAGLHGDRAIPSAVVDLRFHLDSPRFNHERPAVRNWLRALHAHHRFSITPSFLIFMMTTAHRLASAPWLIGSDHFAKAGEETYRVVVEERFWDNHQCERKSALVKVWGVCGNDRCT